MTSLKLNKYNLLKPSQEDLDIIFGKTKPPNPTCSLYILEFPNGTSTEPMREKDILTKYKVVPSGYLDDTKNVHTWKQGKIKGWILKRR